MHKKIAISRVFVCVLLLLLTASLVVSFVAPSLAYFQTIFTSTGINSAKVELIFDRLNFQSENVLNAKDEAGNARFSATAEWGTKQNPYVISAKHHVQNLSVLQNTGFFDKATQAYFLVCTPEGTPVAINCEGMTMAPVGTHANPFTGVIDGAFATSGAEVTYTYTPRSSSDTVAKKSYGVSVSTIGNLIVKASTSEPDIGFFGCVGYYGTSTVDPETSDPAVDGYAASIQNLLLADVTVSSVPTLKDSLAAWWAQVKATMQVEEGKEAPEHRHEDFESHHIGIVAGHADFATINNVSVFYTQGVQTFQISGSSYINYYSTTGLIGTLHYVNPTITSSGLLVGDGNSISDSDMVEVGLGGGGAISGTLTGYMMAGNLYDEHESCVTKVNPDGIYDVKDMKKHDENGNIKDLFESVVMEEGSNKTKVTYRFFKDTVFTFAMSTCSQSGLEAVDYVCRIWPEDENGDAVTTPISGTAEKNDWVYTEDLNAPTRYGYRLERVTSESELNGSGGYFVIAYHDKGENEDIHEDDKLYLVPINTDLENGEVDKQPFSAFYTFTDPDNENNNITTEWDVNGEFGNFSDIKSVTLAGYNPTIYDNAFKNTASKPISAISGSTALAIEATAEIGTFIFWDYWTYNVPTVSVTDSTERVNGDNSTAEDAVSYQWQFKCSENAQFAIYQKYIFYGHAVGNESAGISARNRRGLVAFRFDEDAPKVTFDYSRTERTSNTDDKSAYAGDVTADDYCFVIFRVTPNTSGENGINSDAGNVKLDPMSMKPKDSASVKYNFDPSKYVFQNEIGTDGKPTGKYTLAPISSYNLNTGKGTRLDQLNHIVKLYAATKSNYQMKLGSTLNDLFGVDWFEDTNNGGVLGTQIGVGEKAPYYTIPMGMIAFNILEASDTDPSYINIIVAINPEQRAAGTIGLWQTANTSNFFNQTFNLSDPDQYFNLPKSVLAYNQDYRNDYTVTVSSYTQQNADGSYSVTNGDPTYVYLNGAIAFVYHSFEVTDPGIYLLGSKTGPMSVAYFSVSGAAGTGADGTSTSPLGDVDFVYAYNEDIITIDKKFSGVQDTSNEDYSYYYPSYHFVVMKRDGTDSAHPTVQTENIWVYRYIDPKDTASPKRYISITGCDDTENKGLTDLYQDSSPPA